MPLHRDQVVAPTFHSLDYSSTGPGGGYQPITEPSDRLMMQGADLVWSGSVHQGQARPGFDLDGVAVAMLGGGVGHGVIGIPPDPHLLDEIPTKEDVGDLQTTTHTENWQVAVEGTGEKPEIGAIRFGTHTDTGLVGCPVCSRVDVLAAGDYNRIGHREERLHFGVVSRVGGDQWHTTGSPHRTRITLTQSE